MSKSRELLPKIIQASTDKEAIKVLHDVLQMLHLTSDYTGLVKVKDILDDQQERFRSITDGYDHSNKEIQDMMDARTALNFLYRDLSDLSFEVNKNKVYHEENKSTVKADSLGYLRANESIMENFNAKSTSAMKDIIGYAPQMREYSSLYSMAYGMYKQLDNTLTSVKQFIDLLSGQIRYELMVQQQDAK